jgi:hypothetical protein
MSGHIPWAVVKLWAEAAHKELCITDKISADAKLSCLSTTLDLIARCKTSDEFLNVLQKSAKGFPLFREIVQHFEGLTERIEHALKEEPPETRPGGPIH